MIASQADWENPDSLIFQGVLEIILSVLKNRSKFAIVVFKCSHSPDILHAKIARGNLTAGVL